MKKKKVIASMFITVRGVAGLSQADVAKKMNVTQQAYAGIESGDSLPKLDTIDRFCNVMRISSFAFGSEIFNPDQDSFTFEVAERLLKQGPDTIQKGDVRSGAT